MKTTTKLLLVLTISLLSLKSYSQTFAIKGGLNLFKEKLIIGNQDLKQFVKIRAGIHLGASVEFPVSEKVSIETGLQYSQKGVKIQAEQAIALLNLDYIEMPTTVKFYFLDAGANSRLFGTAGIYAAGLISAKQDNVKLNIGSNPQTDHYKFFDIGYDLGTGIEINESFEIKFFFRNGFTNNDATNTQTEKNRVMGLTLSYKFGR